MNIAIGAAGNIGRRVAKHVLQASSAAGPQLRLARHSSPSAPGHAYLPNEAAVVVNA